MLPTPRPVSDDAVVLADFDATSINSFGSSSRRSSAPNLTQTDFSRPDGQVPDIVYSLYRYNEYNSLIEYKVGDKPHTNLDLSRAAGESNAENNKPVIEIITYIRSDKSDKERRYLQARQFYPTQPPPPPPVCNWTGCDSDSDNDLPQGYFNEPRQILVIHSEHLINSLQAVVAYYPGLVCSKPFKAPYYALYHYRQELASYRDCQPPAHSPEHVTITAQHIDVLLGFLERNLCKELQLEEQRHKLDTPLATFDYYWLLLKPGTVIYAKRHDIWTPYVISKCTVPRDQSRDYRITAWLLESNGTKVQRLTEIHYVHRWQGEQPIASLPVIPAAFWPENLEAQGGRAMRAKQIEEGKLYWELLKRPTYMQYDGLLLGAWRGENVEPAAQTGFMKGRVICDDAGFGDFYSTAPRLRRPCQMASPPPLPPTYPTRDHLPRISPRCGCRACDQNRPRDSHGPFHGFEGLDPLTDTPPDNDLFYLVCSKAIRSFILGTRRWSNLHVADLKPVTSDRDAFKYLVIDEDIKRTVKALIGQFASSADARSVSPWGNDFVRNKGEGRIFLLHGQPGVGKTCTAECIAELTNRPLIALTSGDLSTSSSHLCIEARLGYFLELGQRYGALVLLDEADVYLERRRASDLTRNGLVSVFLRALEYYRGVLFLTTNRVRAFDSAVLSRVHVALHYKNLTHEHRERIWAHNLDRLVQDSGGRVRVSSTARQYVCESNEVRRLCCNGREIRNAVQTALALAESDAREENSAVVVLCERHLRSVLDMGRGFKDYTRRQMRRVMSCGEQVEYEGSEHEQESGPAPPYSYPDLDSDSD